MGRVGCVGDREEIQTGRRKRDIKGGRNRGAEGTRQDKGSGSRRNMAEPELKSRSSRESVAKAVNQEKMEGMYSACSHSSRYHMVQGCIIPPCALMQL